MFPDIGGVEMIIVGVVALLVVKPKDLPVMMRKIGEFMGRARRMANDFRASFEDMARQSELDDLRKQVEAMRSTAKDPTGLASALSETQAEISEGLGDSNFNYGAQTEYVPWEGEETPAPVKQTPKPARKRAPKKAAEPAIVEGGAKPKAPRKTPAKAASAAKTTRAKAAPKIVS